MGFNVVIRFIKGCGPEMVEKTIPVFFDDLPPETTEDQVKTWAAEEARSILVKRGVPRSHQTSEVRFYAL